LPSTADTGVGRYIDGERALSMTLTAIERRVLGVLLEKSLAQPEYYPMTLNAIVAACNQKNNRDPVMELDEDAVWTALEQLRQHGLTSKVLPAPGSRVDRFKHEVDAKWQWPKPQKAIMTELLLRGAQTVGELRTRASRMYAFDNLESVSAVIDWLSSQTPPWMNVLPRAAGQSTVRYAHTLYPDDEKPAHGELSIAHAPQRAERAASTPAELISALQDVLEALQSEVAELHQEVATLRRRIDTLEGR
jgi:uncharacterized protein YceH (UPF0502 family)